MRRELFKLKSLKIKRQKGIVAIEFALGFIAFWSMCILLAEMSFISYTSALGDALISEASHQSKLVQDGQFTQAFDKVAKQQNSLWQSIVSLDSFKTDICYVNNYSDLVSNPSASCANGVNGNGNNGNGGKGAPIAIYSIGYDYTPIFSFFLGNANDVFSREMIVIQEYQR